MPLRVNKTDCAVWASPTNRCSPESISQEMIFTNSAKIFLSMDVSLLPISHYQFTGDLVGPCDEYQTMPYWLL